MTIVFPSTFESCLKKPFDRFYLFERYLFRKGKLGIPQGSIRMLHVKESHEGVLMDHFGVDKTINFLQRKFTGAYKSRRPKELFKMHSLFPS